MGARYSAEPRDSCPSIDATIDQFTEIKKQMETIKECLQYGEESLETTREINETLRMDNRRFEQEIEDKDNQISDLKSEADDRDNRIAELETELQHMKEFVHGRTAAA